MKKIKFMMLFLIVGLVGATGIKDDPRWLITEVMANPDQETSGEFVELVYSGDQEINLGDFWLGDEAESDRIVDYEGIFDIGNEGLTVPARAVIWVVDVDYDGAYQDFFDKFEVDLSSVWMVTVEDGRLGNGLGNNGDSLFWRYGSEILDMKEWTETNSGVSQQWLDNELVEEEMEFNYSPGMIDIAGLLVPELTNDEDIDLDINELNFADDGVWIEVTNQGGEVNLTDWWLSGEFGRFDIDPTILESEENKEIWLEDELRAGELLDLMAEDRLIDRVVLPDFKSGESWVKFLGSWELYQDQLLDDENEVEINNKKDVGVKMIADVFEGNDGEEIIIEGWVTVPLGGLDNNYLWIQDEGRGIKVKWPAVGNVLGDKLRIKGKIHDLKYLRVIQASEIELIGNNDLIVNDIAWSDVAQYESNLVRVNGQVSRVDGDSVYLKEENEDEIRVYLKKDLDWGTKIKKGDELSVIGLVDENSAGWRLLPRFKEDIIWVVRDQSERLPTVGPDWMKIIGFYG